MKKIFFIAVLLLALYFRFNNLNWDSNQHLHPDERFLTMVINDMKLPESFSQYFDQETSLLNPANIHYRFYVYGHFPLILTKYLASIFNKDNYNQITILGRNISALLDLLVIIFIYKIAKILFKEKKKKLLSFSLLATFFYSIFVLPVQLAHFFAVDTFLNFFMIGSFYFILRFFKKRNLIFLIFSAIFFSLALSSKITGIFILPLILVLLFLIKEKLTKKISFIFIFFLITYFSLRFFDPYYFENKIFFDPTPNFLFIENLITLKNLTIKSLDNWYPPMVQWLSKQSFNHSLINNLVFGLGVLPSIFLILSIVLILLNLKNKNFRRENFNLIVVFFWVLAVYFYQSIQNIPTLRYFIYLYPFFALFSAYSSYWFFEKLEKIIKNKLIISSFLFIFLILFLIWPLMFSSIYIKKHTRVEASEWLYKSLPNQSIILGESWDDPLPLFIGKRYGKNFFVKQLPVFDPDNDFKWQEMKKLLKEGDYYVLSSNRGWGSIIEVPKKYPIMSRYYRALLNNDCQKQKEIVDVCYKKIKEFVSYPMIKFQISNFKFEISFPDDWADESFTVYDHPKVMVFKKTKV